jgi:hypothetical protein
MVEGEATELGPDAVEVEVVDPIVAVVEEGVEVSTTELGSACFAVSICGWAAEAAASR